MKITLSAIAKLAPGATLRDPELKGFGARRQQDCVTYFLHTRLEGRQRWITIGRHGSPWTPESARKRAVELMGEIARGENPAERRAEARRKRATLAETLESFFQEHGPKLAPRTREEYRRLFKLHILPALGKKPIDAVGDGDVAKLHAAMAATPRGANFTLAVLSKLMNWAVRRGLAADNPCRGVKKYRERRRERYLSDAELDRLSAALDAALTEGESPYAVAAIRLLLLTGARLTEVLDLRWSYVDLERGLVFLPTSKTGQKPLFLSQAALEVLRALPRLKSNPHVIVGAREGERLVNLQKPWRRLRALADLEDVRLHDLRHSFASFAAAGGASLPQIGALLGHKDPSTTQRYAHLAAAPLHAVNAAVGEKIARHFAKAESRKSGKPD